ncbi:MAG TPA: hypothetical protein VFA75_12290 [Nevskia sp.]|nr:hypothetical protein [Nevskia sp.]
MFKKLILILALSFSMAAQARHAAVPLQDPPPLPVPAGATAVDVEKAIVVSGAQRSWRVVDKKPGVVVLEYAPRQFSVTVTVSYDAHSVKIAYKDSQDMEYGQENGQPVIHPNYNRWTNNLAHDIESQMSILSVK